MRPALYKINETAITQKVPSCSSQGHLYQPQGGNHWIKPLSQDGERETKNKLWLIEIDM